MLRFNKNTAERKTLAYRLSLLSGYNALCSKETKFIFNIGPYTIDRNGDLFIAAENANEEILISLMNEGFIKGGEIIDDLGVGNSGQYNTDIDTLDCVRQLKELNPPVGVYFEKENIDTLDATGELILTILSAMEQDESRSISENIRWSIKRKFQRGEPIVDLNRLIGYDKGENGQWIVNEKQAEVVRYIFNRFIEGATASAIARELNAKNYKTLLGNDWKACNVLSILKNEKYVGDCECQKTYTKSFLTHKTAINNGELPKYYIENHHTPMVDRLTWDRVQGMLMDRTLNKGKKTVNIYMSPLANIVCGIKKGNKICGTPLKRMNYRYDLNKYSDERCAASQGLDPTLYKEKYYYNMPVWKCVNKKKGCSSTATFECAIEQSFMEMLYTIKRDYENLGENSEIAKLYKNSLKKGKISKDEKLERDKSYNLFIQCLLALPDKNSAGQKININGIDVFGTPVTDENGNPKGKLSPKVFTNGKMRITSAIIDSLPNYLKFDKSIYLSSIKEGQIDGDVITYTTNFGVTLTSKGNSRKPRSFIGYRRGLEDGTLEVLDEAWKIDREKPLYVRKDIKEK